jgi:hypothetical protein
VVSERVKVRRTAIAAAVAALGLAGCGNDNAHRAAPPPPRLPRVLADELASQSDELARALDAQDSCRASSLVRVLQARTIAAINARRVPAAFQEPLASTVTDLVSRIRCVPSPAVPRDQDAKGKGKGKGKGEHKHEGND